MSVDVQFFGGIPVGDKIRYGSNTGFTTDTTILNLTTTTGILWGVYVVFGSATGMNNIKVTIDGATERTLSFTNGYGSASTGIYLPVPIQFASSLVLKMTKQGSNSADAVPVYSVF